MAELKLVISADVKPAEQALRAFVTGIEKSTSSIGDFGASANKIGSSINRAFGNLPLGSIEQFRSKILALKADLSNVKFTALPPITADVSPAQQSFRSLAATLDKTKDSFEDFAGEVGGARVIPLNINVTPAQQSLKRLAEDAKKTEALVAGSFDNVNIELDIVPINVDTTPAQQSLKTLSSAVAQSGNSIEKFGADARKTLGPLPLDIEKFRQTFAAFKADLDKVKFSAIPPITADIRPAQTQLKILTDEVKSTAGSVGIISAAFTRFSTDVNKSLGLLSVSSLENFKRAFFDFKNDLSNVKISALPPLNIDTTKAQQSLKNFAVNVDATIDAVKADLNSIEVNALPAVGIDIRPAETSLNALKVDAVKTGDSILGVATSIQKFSTDVRTALGALPLHNIEAFRQAFLNFKADLGNIKISAIPPIKVDVKPAQQSLQTLSQEAEKTGNSVSVVAVSFERFSKNIAQSFGALPLSSIAAFRDAFLDFKSDLSNVKISTIPPVKVDISQAQNSLRTLTEEAMNSTGVVSSLASAYARWSQQATVSSGEVVTAMQQVSKGVATVGDTAQKGFGAIITHIDKTGASIQRFNALREAFLKFKADLSNVTITALPPITTDATPAIRSLDDLQREASESAVAITNVSSAFRGMSTQVTSSAGTATKAIKEVDLTVETLRAKIAVRKDLIVTSKDITQIIKYNKEIEHLEAVLEQIQNAGRKGFFGGAPLDNLSKSTLKAHGSLSKVKGSSEQATNALLNLGRVAQDAPFGFLGIANNLNPLLESFQRLKGTAGSTGGALKALGSSLIGPAGIGVALSAASSLLIVFGDKLFQSSEKTTAAAEALKKYKETSEGIFQATAKEATQVGSLIALLKSETETRERKLLAIKELQEIQPEVFKNLKLEGDAVVGLDLAYQNYLKNLKTVIAVKLKQAQLEGKITELLKKQGIEQTSREKKLFDLQKFEDFNKTVANSFVAPEDAAGNFFKSISKGAADASKSVESDIEGLLKDIGELSKGIELQGDKSGATNKKLADGLKDFIERAKQLNSELEKIGFIAPVRFSFFDTFEEQLKKARKVFDDFNSHNLKIDPKIFTFPSFSEPEIRERVKQALGVVEEGIRIGTIGLPKIPIGVNVEFSEVTNFTQNTDLIREFKDRFKNLSRILPNIDMDLAAGLNRGVFLDAIRKFFKTGADVAETEILKFADQTEKNLSDLAAAINAAINNIAIAGFAGIGEAIGAALAGSDVGNAFKAFANVVADAVSAIGKQFITLGVTAILAKKALAQLFAQPALAIAAGVALIAVAAALRASLNKGVTGFAQGGLVFGPTVGLIGEGQGTSRSNPEVVAPLDKLKGMLDNSGGRLQPVVLKTRIRGNDILLSNNRTNRRNDRLG